MRVKIVLPTELCEKAQRLAGGMGVSVEQLLALALSHYQSLYQGVHITQTLDALYESEAASLDPRLLRMQSASLDDERW